MKKLSLGLLVMMAIGIWTEACRITDTSQNGIEAEIGHFLFFDKKLSYNDTKSCASCHDPQLAFTDGYHRSIGATGDIHKRNAPSILNISDNKYFTFADSSIHSIYQQVQIPLFNTQFIELGTGLNTVEILRKINQDPLYKNLFKKVDIDTLTLEQLRYFLETYCQGLKARQSRFDLVKQGQSQFSPDEKMGFELFYGSRLKCGSCHGGIDFDQPLDTIAIYVHNGFFEKDSSHVNRKFGTDWGLFELTNNEADKAKFKIPSLRNCLLTAPYMHDGSINSIDSVLSIYSKGGKGHLTAHSTIEPFELTATEKTQLIRFLETLTDTSYLSRHYFRDPFH